MVKQTNMVYKRRIQPISGYVTDFWVSGI